MPSIQSLLLHFYLRRNMKEKAIHLMPPQQLRDGIEKLAPNKPPKGVSLEIVPGGPVRGEWHRADTAVSGRTVLYLHGGGYYFGSAKTFRGFTFGLAKQARCNVFSLDYRLAPEAPYPAAVDDALTCYRWLLESGIDPATLILGGDSSGGGLSLALLLKAKEKSLPLPAGLFLFSPWTDLACTGASLDENEKTDVMFKRHYITEGAKTYYGDHDPKTAFISPLYGDLTGLPPTLSFVSTSEILRDDGLRLHEKLVDDGVLAELITEDGLAHEWPTFYGRIPEARKSMAQLVAFIETQLARV